MELSFLRPKSHEGENNACTLRVSVEQAHWNKEIRIHFVAPSGNKFFSDAITLSSGEADYQIPYYVLDSDGVMQAQIVASNAGGTVVVKSDIYRYYVDKSIEGGIFTELSEGDADPLSIQQIKMELLGIIQNSISDRLIDSSLEQEGWAAESKTVGNYFKKTPYWRGILPYGENLDTIKYNSMYRLLSDDGDNSYINAPDIIPRNTARYLISVGNESQGFLQVMCGQHADIVTRRCVYRTIDGVSGWYWDVWEGGIDKSLTRTNASADAAKVGEKLQKTTNIIKSYNVYPISDDYFTLSSGSHNGITYTWSDGSFIVTGTSTDISIHRLYYNRTEMPDWFVPGKHYFVKYSTTNTNVRLQFVFAINGSSVYYEFTDDGIITVPQEATECQIRLVVNADKTFTTAATVALALLTETPNTAIEDKLAWLDDEVNGVPLFKNTYFGHIKTDGTWATESGNYAIYPVTSGDKLTVIAKNGVSSSGVALLKSYTAPTSGNTVDFSEADGLNELVIITNANSPFAVTIPEDAHYLYVYMGHGTERLPAAVRINDYDIMTDMRGNIVEYGRLSGLDAPMKIRVMQYNIGKYNYGRQSPTGIPDAVFNEKIMGYRKLLTSYAPDIVGLEEYREIIGQEGGTHEDATANEEVFDQVLPNEAVYLGHERAIKSKCPTVRTGYGTITVHVDENNEVVESAGANTVSRSAYYVKANTVFGNRSVAVLCLALSWEHDAQTVVARSEQLTRALSLLENDEYAIVTIDQNSGGDDITVTTEDEANSLLTLARSLGFEGSNGAYLPWVPTNYGEASQYGDLFIDNIYYKNNGKIVFCDFDVLSNEYDNLTSDHYPVIGDFLLL